jgi:catechol 2,3-dioxygenase
MSSAMRLGPVHLQIASLARSIDYYQRTLGLRVIERGEHGAVLGAWDQPEPLVVLHEHPGATPVPRRGRLGLYHFAILLPDRPSLGRFVRHLAENGIHAGMSDHAVSEAIYLYDPDGLGIEVYADRPRELWRSENQQLVLALDPLDVEGLVHEAGDDPWQGMPAGTTMGHIHFFVPDLARAEAFHHRGLGLDKIAWSYPGALFLSAGGYHHHVAVNTWAHQAALAGPGDARLLEWTIVLPGRDEVEAVARGLAEVGAELAGEPGARTVLDPFGNRLRLATS